MRRERSLGAVPKAALAVLLLGFTTQLLWHALRPEPLAHPEKLPLAPSLGLLRAASLGEPHVMARLMMLWLQAFDNQPGISIPFRKLDYTRVIGWLERALGLDPRGQYPLLAASRLYTEVPDAGKQRQMLDFVYRAFLRDPNRRWPWLAHGVYVAKHRLQDLPLALRFAKALADHATGPEVPHWAQQMQIFVLQDMGEIEAAKVLIGALLESGRISDPQELRFLAHRLRELESQGVVK